MAAKAAPISTEQIDPEIEQPTVEISKINLLSDENKIKVIRGYIEIIRITASCKK